MTQPDSSKIDQLLDLLLDALQERQTTRGEQQSNSITPPAAPIVDAQPISNTTTTPPSPPPHTLRNLDDMFAESPLTDAEEQQQAATDDTLIDPLTDTLHEEAPLPYLAEKLPTIHLDHMLSRLALLLLGLIIVINIPFNRYGTNLARAMPDAQALVIRDGLVLKGDDEKIYVLQDNHKRWISSLDAFDYYGYHWGQVNIVEDDFLAQFPDGPPLSILYKCNGSPHVFAIEEGAKRWIKDIPTFESQGYVWEDVQIVSCARLESIPAGRPIPPNAGSPP